jgi:CHAT domain-containing protein
MGYSLTLAEAGDTRKALETIQSILVSDQGNRAKIGVYENPAIESLKIDSKTLKILSTKYNILWSIYSKSPDRKKLEAASNTAELIVSLLEKLRINISDEESRLLLGDNYRDSYLNAIRDFNLLYSESSENKFLEKSFEYMEKSKVAGLLASTRELKATQFHIPADIADFERRLQRDMSFFNARIDEEIVRIKPDTGLIRIWHDNILKTTRLRDSLIFVFEKNYPGYYSLKYNTSVVTLKEVPEIVGRRGNYLNYVISDSILYIFISNRKHQKLLALPIDSAFFNNLFRFRSFLTRPASSSDAKNEFEKYQSVGYELYKTLIDQARPYLISDNLIISPDNILSYIPFETIPTRLYSGEKIKYGSLAYLMNDFNISYVYSATFMSESGGLDLFHNNKVIAFAPNYSEQIDIQSVLEKRQVKDNILLDLPFARDEAQYVADITDGSLYINEEAMESVYKSESGKFDIVHLAMHTILNDKTPMHSTLIFSKDSDSTQDGYLKTYEVYGIPLKAKMVVLSSCNTGDGLLSSGEGILSLARGFIYSGSRSVVMSMWEIEDRSGTEIVKKFYKNLKGGYSKSRALRKARASFLKNADQLRSHPYVWSSLVIYGNNDPLFFSGYFIVLSILAVLIIVLFIISYLRKRKYS